MPTNVRESKCLCQDVSICVDAPSSSNTLTSLQTPLSPGDVFRPELGNEALQLLDLSPDVDTFVHLLHAITQVFPRQLPQPSDPQHKTKQVSTCPFHTFKKRNTVEPLIADQSLLKDLLNLPFIAPCKKITNHGPPLFKTISA